MNIFFTALCFILTILVLPFLLPVVLILGLHKSYVYMKVKRELTRKGEICNMNDAIHIHKDPASKIQSILFRLHGKLDVEKCQNDIERKFVFALKENGERMFPKATRYIKFKSLVWVEENSFDIKEHVFLCKETPKNKEDFRKLMGRLISEPLQEHLARWQFILIPSTASDDVPVHHILFKVHHAVADGTAIVRLFEKFAHVPAKESSPNRVAVKSQLWNTVRAIFTAPSLILERTLTPPDSNILQSPVLSGQKVSAWSKGIDINVIKRIKNAAGTTVNDVLIACVAGSIRKYFKTHASTVTNRISCIIPVDMRKSAKEADNQSSGFLLTLPTHTDDPIETLRESKQRMDALKSSVEHIVADAVFRLNMATGLHRIYIPDMFGKFTMVFTNVRVPHSTVFIGGNPVENIAALSLTSGGLFVNATSYNNKVVIGISADTNVLDDPSLLVTGFEEKLDELAREFNVLE